MALPTWYDTGTVSVANGSALVTGTGTLWGSDAIMAGDLFCDLAQPLVPPQRIASVEANGALTLAAPWPGTSLTDDDYEIRYVGIIERSTSQTRRVLEQLGEVSAYFDIQVDDTGARLALESVDAPLRANYRVLVSDIGDGTAAIYSKASSAYDDWTAPAPYSGPVGPTGPTGPAAITWEGAYDAGTTYAIDAGVRFNGTTFRKLTSAGAGNAPSSASPPVDNANWEVVAAKGLDGTGTGDVVGPSGAVADRLALFDGPTGKAVKDSGKTIAQVMADAITPHRPYLNKRVGLTSDVATISMSFDYYGSVYTDAYGIMDANGLVGTYFLVPSMIGTAGFPTSVNIQALKRDGWELGIYPNTNMVTQEAADRAAAYAIMKDMKDALLAYDIEAVSMCAPSRAWNQRLTNEIRGLYSHVRVASNTRATLGRWANLPELNPLWMADGGTSSLSTADTGASLSATIDDLIALGGGWHCVIHQVADTGDPLFRIPIADFTTFCAKVKTERDAGNLRVCVNSDF
jgi:hypothetical protein